MRLFLAVMVPWFLFFTIKRPIAGVVCVLLQLLVVGWIPAAIWAVHALGQFKTDKKIGALEKSLKADADPQAGAAEDPGEGPAEAPEAAAGMTAQAAEKTAE